MKNHSSNSFNPFPVLLAVVLVGTLPTLAAQGVVRSDGRIELERRIDQLKGSSTDNPRNAQLWFDLGVSLHTLSSQFGVARSKEAIEALENSYRLNPDPVTRAFLGSAWTLAGRDGINPIEKIDNVTKGNEILDQAVAMAPDNLLVRRIRYENSFALPDIFERRAVAAADIDYLLLVYRRNPTIFDGVYDPAHVFYYKARLLIHANDWRRARQFATLGRRIARDPSVITLLENFLQGKDN